ncbi:MAG: type II toxin-antitoxin system YafQ family toxin [Bacteroidaceae bacterium]|nr:type II toxin-antitoxin system YafQ family toxin [Bacteroidaceae bacterium]
MKKIYPSTQFKKDYKRYRNNPKLIKALGDIVDKLANEQPIPHENRPHPLKGEYKGCMECHVGNDFLLIWLNGDIIELVRLGSHSELFKSK